MTELNAIVNKALLLQDACEKSAALFRHLNANVNPEPMQSPEWPINIILQSEDDAKELTDHLQAAQNALRDAGFKVQ